MAKNKIIKVGVIGVGRGMSFAKATGKVGMKLVAICDQWVEKLNEAGKTLGVKTYTDYDKFLNLLNMLSCYNYIDKKKITHEKLIDDFLGVIDIKVGEPNDALLNELVEEFEDKAGE